MTSILQKVQELPEDLIKVIKKYIVENPLKARLRNVLFCEKMVRTIANILRYDWCEETQKHYMVNAPTYEDALEFAKKYLRIKITAKSITVYGACFADPTKRFDFSKDYKDRFTHHVKRELVGMWLYRERTILERVWKKAGVSFESLIKYSHSPCLTMERFAKDLPLEDEPNSTDLEEVEIDKE